MGKKYLPYLQCILLFLVVSGTTLGFPIRTGSLENLNAQNQANEMVQLINAYRSSLGLAPLQTNANLMSAAQFQSDYSAFICGGGHVGPPGFSTEEDRAIAFGYGDGNKVAVREVLAYGEPLSPAEALEGWKSSPGHNTLITHPDSRDIGVGISFGCGWHWYIVDLGNIFPGMPGPRVPTVDPDLQSFIVPVSVATPQLDGSVIHEVQSGQSLWMIANAYGISLQALLQHNSLTENSVLHPGDTLLVFPSWTPTPIPSPSLVTSSPTVIVSSPPIATSTSLDTIPGSDKIVILGSPLFLPIIASLLLLIGIGILILSTRSKR